MNKLFLALSFSAFALTAYAQQPTMTEWHDLQVNEVNRFTPILTFSVMSPKHLPLPVIRKVLPIICHSMGHGALFGWTMPTNGLSGVLILILTTMPGLRCLYLGYGNSTATDIRNM